MDSDTLPLIFIGFIIAAAVGGLIYLFAVAVPKWDHDYSVWVDHCHSLGGSVVETGRGGDSLCIKNGLIIDHN